MFYELIEGTMTTKFPIKKLKDLLGFGYLNVGSQLAVKFLPGNLTIEEVAISVHEYGKKSNKKFNIEVGSGDVIFYIERMAVKQPTHAERYGYAALEIGQEISIDMTAIGQSIHRFQVKMHNFGKYHGKKFASQKCIVTGLLLIRRIA